MGIFSFLIRTSAVRVKKKPRKKDYHAGRYANPASLRAERSGRGVWIRVAVLGVMVAALLAVVYRVLLSGAFRITEITVDGTARTDPEELRAAAMELLNRKRMLILNQRDSLFLTDTARMRVRLIERFALKQAVIAPKLPHTLAITVEERVPAFAVRTPEKTFFIDDEGIMIGSVTARAHDAPILLTLSVPDSLDPATGERALGRDTMAYLMKLQNAFISITQGYRITELNLERILVHDITAVTSEPWVVYMTDTLDPKTQVLNIDRALLDLKDERKNIQYIDVRLPTKIFYK